LPNLGEPDLCSYFYDAISTQKENSKIRTKPILS